MTKKLTPPKPAAVIKRDDVLNISGNAVTKSVHLAASDTKDISRVTSVMVDVIRRQRRLWRKELNDWTAARYARYQAEIPRTYPLEEVYDDIMLDGHLAGITGNRTLRNTNKNYVFAIDGKKDATLTDYIKDREWFEYTLEKAHESVYRGHSLLWIKQWTKGNITEVELIPRGMVIPEQHVLLYDSNGLQGIDFSAITDVLWYAQFYDPVGLLEKAAPYTILKRHSWGSWDEFEELFGIPIRIAKIASQSEAVKNEVAGWLEEMGSAPYAVFPLGTEVEIKENSKADSFNVFYQKIKALDAELSKLVLHQTMTTENGASNAQGNVHENTMGEVTRADDKKQLAFLNNRVVPAMRRLGYALPDAAKIIIETTKDPSEQIKIDSLLLSNGYVLKKQYIEETYGVAIARMPGTANADETQPPEPG